MSKKLTTDLLAPGRDVAHNEAIDPTVLTRTKEQHSPNRNHPVAFPAD